MEQREFIILFLFFQGNCDYFLRRKVLNLYNLLLRWIFFKKITRLSFYRFCFNGKVDFVLIFRELILFGAIWRVDLEALPSFNLTVFISCHDFKELLLIVKIFNSFCFIFIHFSRSLLK